MFDRNRSGQFLFFGLISAISGDVVVGASGAISGRRSIDGGSQTLLSGFVSELAGGQYVANLYDFDLNGNCIGFFFTASGCVPVNYTVITQQNVSGRIFAGSGLTYPASGANTLSPIASGTIYLASGSLVNLLSGNLVGLYSGQSVITSINQDKSGYTASTLSGTTYLVSGQTTLVASGTLIPASGSIFSTTFASGVLAVEIPYGILASDMSGVTSEAARSPLNALRKLMNRWQVNGSGLHIYKENDTTVAYVQTITATSGASPITALNTTE